MRSDAHDNNTYLALLWNGRTGKPGLIELFNMLLQHQFRISYTQETCGEKTYLIDISQPHRYG